VRATAPPNAAEHRFEPGLCQVVAAPTAVAVDELEQLATLCVRIDSARPSAATVELLEPLAGFVGAETASFRSLTGSELAPRPTRVVTLGIPDPVNDAYLARYFRLDPARRLLRRRIAGPVFAHPTRDGEWADERAAPLFRERYREEFAQYRKEFLAPNHFVHHVGFGLQDPGGDVLLFDFHRPARSPAFGRLERARAKTVSLYLRARMAPRLELGARGGALEQRLSGRELEVAQAVARGLANKEIAADLGVSVRTIENHLRSIFAKLGVTTRGRLAAALRSAEPGSVR
jgi:DNA-binding CsgD family transcriptional regulator